MREMRKASRWAHMSEQEIYQAVLYFAATKGLAVATLATVVTLAIGIFHLK
ncbi:hypothetical protein [Burkholderia sp. Ac-20379]|uniref:hypothetical protein n=1 Tax=Burkholderia sp. Ac-20379 TaxID=2703900 RepID=UPI00197DD20B|nr:hypothetical protein [Burkholderia sp. Ac-20379]MBN3723856.1 hypothetical protein [Burkholderia sp. Ac-20379]